MATIGPNLITNGTFDTATTGWLASTGVSIASVSGVLEVTDNETGTAADGALQIVTGIKPGRKYRFTVNAIDSDTQGWKVTLSVGATFTDSGTGAKSVSADVTATGDTINVLLHGSQTPANLDVVDYDNASLCLLPSAGHTPFPKRFIINGQVVTVRSWAELIRLEERQRAEIVAQNTPRRTTERPRNRERPVTRVYRITRRK